MRQAVAVARTSTADTSSRFRVGALLVHDGRVVETGCTAELPGNTHAEECALAKLAAGHSGLDLYTTLQPCTIRSSGLKTCTERIVESGLVRRVFVGAGEPGDFVDNVGYGALEAAGIEVVIVEDAALADEALRVARGQT